MAADGGAALADAETLNEPIVNSGLSPEDAQLSRSLSFLLAHVLCRPPLQLMKNVGYENGLEAWRLLVRSEQPVSGAKRIAARLSFWVPAVLRPSFGCSVWVFERQQSCGSGIHGTPCMRVSRLHRTMSVADNGLRPSATQEPRLFRQC